MGTTLLYAILFATALGLAFSSFAVQELLDARLSKELYKYTNGVFIAVLMTLAESIIVAGILKISGKEYPGNLWIFILPAFFALSCAMIIVPIWFKGLSQARTAK